MEATAMNEDVQMNKTGKLARSLKTVQTALEQIIAKAVLRILLRKNSLNGFQ